MQFEAKMSARNRPKTLNTGQSSPDFEEIPQAFMPRRIESQNIAFRLFTREIFGGSPSGNGMGRDHRGRPVSTTRGFFLNVFPNYTLVNVEKPPCFLRKFTPDGRYFIAFSPCQTHLEVLVVFSFKCLDKKNHEKCDYDLVIKNWTIQMSLLLTDFVIR